MSLPAPHGDSTVVITGASAGIGTELARQLAAKGHGLTLVARRKERLDELADELGDTFGVKVDSRKADLGDRAARTRLIKSLQEGDRQVSAVCNNAGFGTFGAFHELDLDRENEQVQLNIVALHMLTGAFLADMVDRGSGAVLNVASIAAYQPIPYNATYAATKAFVVSFSEAVHSELAGTGVSCTALCPGPVGTEFGEVAGVGALESSAPDFAVQTAEEVAQSGIEAMEKGKRSVYPGLIPRIAAAGGRFVPRSAYLPVAGRVVKRALGDRGRG